MLYLQATHSSCTSDNSPTARKMLQDREDFLLNGIFFRSLQKRMLESYSSACNGAALTPLCFLNPTMVIGLPANGHHPELSDLPRACDVNKTLRSADLKHPQAQIPQPSQDKLQQPPSRSNTAFILAVAEGNKIIK